VYVKPRTHAKAGLQEVKPSMLLSASSLTKKNQKVEADRQ
jgi:hypothetical protein